MNAADHACSRKGRTCATCRACDPHRYRQAIRPARGLPYGVIRCRYCDGELLPRTTSHPEAST